MMQYAVPVLVALALLTAIAAGRELLSPRGDAPIVRVLVLAIVGISVVFETRYFPRSQAVQLATLALVVALVVVVAVGPPTWRNERSGARVKGLFLIVSAWAVMFVSDVWHNYGLGEIALLGRLAPGIFWVALLCLWMVGGLRREALGLALALTLAGVTVSIVFVPAPFAPCNEFKCGLLGGLLKGPFASENYFAILAVFALVLAFGGTLGRAKLPVIALAATVLVATGGRSSQVAASVALLVMAMVTRLARGGRPTEGLARTAAFGLPAVCGAVGLWLVYYAAPTELSNRGVVWARAREVLGGYESFGRGISRWEGYGASVPVSQHFPHSVYLLVLFSGGLVAVVLLLVAVGRAIIASGTDAREFRVVLGYATAVLVLGLSEITVNLMSIDGLCWLLLPLFARGVSAGDEASTTSRSDERPRVGEASPGVRTALPREGVIRPATRSLR